MTLNALGWSQVVYQSRLLLSHCISTFQIHLMDYSDQNFTKIKYSDLLTPTIWRDQPHLDPHTDFVSIWLYPVAFCHCIKNSNSPAPKHSEFFANHYDDLRSERHLYPYASWVALDSRMLNKWVTCSVMMYSNILPVCHTSVTILFS